MAMQPFFIFISCFLGHHIIKFSLRFYLMGCKLLKNLTIFDMENATPNTIRNTNNSCTIFLPTVFGQKLSPALMVVL